MAAPHHWPIQYLLCRWYLPHIKYSDTFHKTLQSSSACLLSRMFACWIMQKDTEYLDDIIDWFNRDHFPPWCIFMSFNRSPFQSLELIDLSVPWNLQHWWDGFFFLGASQFVTSPFLRNTEFSLPQVRRTQMRSGMLAMSGCHFLDAGWFFSLASDKCPMMSRITLQGTFFTIMHLRLMSLCLTKPSWANGQITTQQCPVRPTHNFGALWHNHETWPLASITTSVSHFFRAYEVPKEIQCIWCSVFFILLICRPSCETSKCRIMHVIWKSDITKALTI